MAVLPLMSEVDMSGWPIAAVRLDDVTDASDVAALAGAVASALERQNAFGLLIASNRPLPDGPPVAEPLRWLRRRRTEIGTWCYGVAYVLPRSALDRVGAADETAARRLWGCDVKVTDDLAVARAWLLAALQSASGRR